MARTCNISPLNLRAASQKKGFVGRRSIVATPLRESQSKAKPLQKRQNFRVRGPAGRRGSHERPYTIYAQASLNLDCRSGSRKHWRCVAHASLRSASVRRDRTASRGQTIHRDRRTCGDRRACGDRSARSEAVAPEGPATAPRPLARGDWERKTTCVRSLLHALGVTRRWRSQRTPWSNL